MKKILVLMLLLAPLAYCMDEVPVLPLDNGVDIQYTNNSASLINVDGVKKNKALKKAKEELKETPSSAIQVDNNYLKHQRALDYIDNPNRALMPPIL